MIILMRFIVSGHSMEPMFKPGQTLLVSGIPYLFRQPEIGDTIVVKDPRNGRLLLKRIAKIENNIYFVSGDNEKASTDSRTFGGITKTNIVGNIIYTQ